MDLNWLIKNSIRISADNANLLASKIRLELNKEIMAVKATYEEKLQKLTEEYEAKIASMKNESMESMIRRIASEEVEKNIKSNLTIDESYDPYSGRQDPTWHLEWNGKEF